MGRAGAAVAGETDDGAGEDFGNVKMKMGLMGIMGILAIANE